MTTARLAELLVNYRWLNCFISIFAFLLLASGAKNTYFESDYRIFFDDSNPQLIQQNLIESEYTNSDNVTFVISTKSNDLFNEKDLASLLQLTKDAWQLPYSIRVDSITNFQYTHADEDDLIVEDLLDEEVLDDLEGIEKKKSIAINEVTLRDFVISPDARVTSVTVLLQLPDIQVDKDKATHEAVNAARELIKKHESENNNLSIYLVGQTTVNVMFNELSQRDSAVLFPIMFAVMALLLAILLKSFTGMLATQTIIILSVAATIGIMGWTHSALNQVTAALPVIILTLAVCDSVHILNSFSFNLGDGQEKKEALINSYRTNIQPVFLTSLTTAIGFLSMNFSDSPPFQQLGNWAALGVMLAFVWSLTALPALAWIAPSKRKASKKLNLGKRFSQLLANNKKSIGFTSISFVIFFIMLIPKNELNDNTVGYFKESVPFRQAADFMQANLTGFDQFAYSLNCGAPNCINEPSFLKQLETFNNWLLQQPEIIHTVTYTDIIKRLNKNMNEDIESFYTIPPNVELSAQYQLLYELSLPFGLDLNNLLNMDKSATKLTLVIKDQKAQELLDLESRIDQWLLNNLPDLRTTGAGISLMFAHLGQRNIFSMVEGSLIALLLVTLTIIMSLRSIKYGLISIIPNSVPAAVAFGIWAVLLAEVNVAVAVVFSFTLGIIVDDTVHFLTKYIRARKELGMSANDAIEYSFSVVGKALIITTVVLASGFFVLGFSDFNVNAYMGLMVGITIIVALILDFILLPLFLMVFDKEKITI